MNQTRKKKEEETFSRGGGNFATNIKIENANPFHLLFEPVKMDLKECEKFTIELEKKISYQ